MRILVTGHRGFIGSHVYRVLTEEGHQVDGVEWHDHHTTVMDYDWVVHLGAISSTTERDIDKVLRQNLDYSIELFDNCKTFGVNLQYASSASIYGLGDDFREFAAPDPRNPYAWSKYLFERYVQQHQGGNIVQGFRYFNVYGTGELQKGNQASPVTQFRKQARRNGEISLFQCSDQYCRDFVCVEDVVSTHIAMMDTKASGVFNVGTGNTRSFADIAYIIAEQEQVDIVEIAMPDQLRGNYQEYTCADLTLLNSTIGPRKWTDIESWLDENRGF